MPTYMEERFRSLNDRELKDLRTAVLFLRSKGVPLDKIRGLTRLNIDPALKHLQIKLFISKRICLARGIDYTNSPLETWLEYSQNVLLSGWFIFPKKAYLGRKPTGHVPIFSKDELKQLLNVQNSATTRKTTRKLHLTIASGTAKLESDRLKKVPYKTTEYRAVDPA